MKNLIAIPFFLICLSLQAQHQDIPVTDAFTVSGAIKKEQTFTLDDLSQWEKVVIDDVEITNHVGEKKGTATDLKGILLKDVLGQITFDAESPKVLSEFYLTFIAADGYKVVFSWNEIFNTPTGDHLYLITQKDGQPLNKMDDRILIMSTTDFKTGRRHLKSLSRVVVGRVS